MSTRSSLCSQSALWPKPIPPNAAAELNEASVSDGKASAKATKGTDTSAKGKEQVQGKTAKEKKTKKSTQSSATDVEVMKRLETRLEKLTKAVQHEDKRISALEPLCPGKTNNNTLFGTDASTCAVKRLSQRYDVIERNIRLAEETLSAL
jgi:hypothetical protein